MASSSKKNKKLIYYFISRKRFLYRVTRRKRILNRKKGEKRHLLLMKKHASLHGTMYSSEKNKILPTKPEYSANIKFLGSFPDLFTTKKFSKLESAHFFIPECFSLIENYQESFEFLKRLFVALYKGKFKTIQLDYINCKRIDVDASICMDIILAEFIVYLNKCTGRGYKPYPLQILPINFGKDEIKKVLFSIGAYRNLRNLKINFPDIEGLSVLINHQSWADRWQKSELHTTEIVEYIKRCLKRMNRELTIEAETGFYKVIGEIMSNAEEHGTMPNRYAIGFFQEVHDTDEHYGIFNFSIFNFGKTIYDTFKSEDCQNKAVVEQMRQLSQDYTTKGWFTKALFEEETLWTLYSLQEGVTSKEKKRGNGSIQYIENFFRLKGDMLKDNVSKLTIMSGNSRIEFDGTYHITTKPGKKRNFKMMTFNESGDISDKPDKNYVTFAPHYFPGTLVSARILIKFDNTTNDNK